MAIEILFEFGSQRVGVEIKGEAILFYDFQSLLRAPIEGLKLSYEGTIKEFPELKDNPEWNKIAIEKFKQKIKDLPHELARRDYIIEELRKVGYKPLYYQINGWRPVKIK